MAAANPKPDKPTETLTPTLEQKPHLKLVNVLDTTAQAGQPARAHEMIVDGAVKCFTFEAGKPLALPPAVALKFLRHDAFKMTDPNGTPIAYKRRPKQPDELEAGEKLVLKDEQTVANYDELSTAALQLRVLEMPGSDQFAEAPSRKAMIDFLISTKLAAAKANTSKEADIGRDGFVPEAEEEEAA